ncbi:MAG: Lrp/AsnC ligand binding domain-containing protein [Nanoarchaeota archaeon]|nr:Lrp/AsnC ligand binding domain-containing protein [Nanoarchaeota archaeon]MBU1270237.1 Lrp/AsnC ligand binding domain-containing protein [Nanoarchaeota archaeon]MBU1604809.1 Lrp/AsnC ligand binding domain-containing protein [Nanoarchaeota archaeon]MBU2442835.1 Lrp/AsnC ligand binding domain-containing protein [Nanoarchaeota archaeon]
MIAYVLISLLDRDEREILDKLLSYKKVLEAHILFGEWDIIAKIEAKTPEEAGTFVMEKIRSLPNVKITSTLIVAR